MNKQHLSPLYFGLFAAYLAVFNWDDSPLVSSLFLAGALATFVQLVRPNVFLNKPLFILAALFCLSYAGAIVRVMIETGDIMPFSPRGNQVFLWNCTVAVLNFFMLFFWFKNGLHAGKTREVSHVGI